MTQRTVSRRDMFRVFFGRRQEEPAPLPEPQHAPSLAPPATAANELALILDRFCLAHQGGFCSVCVERCPAPGAIVTVNGKPSVVADHCTGCHICHEVCPAPKKAIFFVSRKPRPGMIGKTVSETEPPPPQEETEVKL